MAILEGDMAIDPDCRIRYRNMMVCAICGSKMDLLGATIVACDNNGEPVFAHEYHRARRRQWFYFWAKHFYSQQDLNEKMEGAEL